MIFKSIKTGGIPRVLIAILGGPGVCRPVLQVLTLFQTKKCHFPHRFKTWPVRNYVTITVRRLTLKRFLKTHFEFAYMIYSRSSLENHTRIQTKSGKSLCPFSNQNGEKTIPFGAAHTLSQGGMAYARLQATTSASEHGQNRNIFVC